MPIENNPGGGEIKSLGGKMSTTGKKPGKGTYHCTVCGQVVILDDDTDTLPPCARCSGTDFTP